MKKKDLIKSKRKSSEINCLLTKKESKMTELPRIIWRVNRKKRK